MTKKTKKVESGETTRFDARRFFPYLVLAILIIGVAFFGSKEKFEDRTSSLDMRAIAQNNYSASADQTAEMYVVTEIAKSMNTPSSAVIAINYDSITSAASLATGSSSDKLEKPSVVNTSHLAVGVVEYVVSNGETLNSIADKYSASGVTETMIRWSNNLKAGSALTPGQTILVPGRAGFVYRVKAGETIETIATKYRSSVEEIVAANSLELNTNLAVGTPILIPDGELPENERPDYVAPVATRRGNSTYSYSAQYSAGNRYAYGWCTWYAWSKRPDLPGNMGNANMWATNARRAGFSVDGTPRAGDIFQTGSGRYGHVGYVESVNGDGTITVSDMNYNGRWGKVTVRVTSPSGLNFIHKK